MRSSRIAIVAALITLLAACGSSSKSSTAVSHPAQPAPNGSFVPGELGSLPTLPRMKALGQEQRTDGVTTQSYRLTGYDARGAVDTYGKQLAGWHNSVRPHPVGTSWRGTWVRDRYSLVVTAIKAPTLPTSASGEELQMTLQLYSPNVTPPTDSPYG